MRSRLFITTALTVIACSAFAQYASKGVRLHSNVPLSAMLNAPTGGAACYGYVSPSGREYAIMGHRQGSSFFDITNPSTPTLIGQFSGPVSTWREMTVLGNYAYVVSDQVGVGVQIVDLNQADSGVATLSGVYNANGLSTVHTIQANPASNFLYLNGSNLGFVILNATNRTAPTQVATWNTRYVHDSQIVTYTSGPYAGKEIAFLCCGSSGLYIVDVTNKANLVTLANINYLNSNKYCHSGQLSADKQYFLINDEFDESNTLVSKCTTHIINVANLSAPTYAGSYTNNGNYIDHNSNMRGDFLMLAAYRGGLRVYDCSTPNVPKEVGFFDTYPTGDGFSFSGAWGTFSDYPSGNSIISDMNRGLFVLDPTEAAGLGAVQTAVSPAKGTVVTTGDTKSLRRKDTNYLIADADPKKRTNPKVLQLDLTSDTTVASSIDRMFSLRLCSNNPNTLVTFWLKNVNTGQFEQVGSGVYSTFFSTVEVPAIEATNYVSSAGKIEARIVASLPANAKKALNILIDQWKIDYAR